MTVRNGLVMYHHAIFDYHKDNHEFPFPNKTTHWQRRLCPYIGDLRAECENDNQLSAIDSYVYLLVDEDGTYAPSLQEPSKWRPDMIVAVGDSDEFLTNYIENEHENILDVKILLKAASEMPDKRIFLASPRSGIDMIQLRHLKEYLNIDERHRF